RAMPTLDETFLESQLLMEKYRITSVGAYHLAGWLPTFAYLDAISFDTPIFEGSSYDAMADVSNSFNIADRLRRTEEFSKYLTANWHASGLNPRYFDWAVVERNLEESFKLVRAAVARREYWEQQRQLGRQT